MTDLYEILYADTDGPYPNACDICYYNFEISTKLGHFFFKIWTVWTLFDCTLVVMSSLQQTFTSMMPYHSYVVFQFKLDILKPELAVNFLILTCFYSNGHYFEKVQPICMKFIM